LIDRECVLNFGQCAREISPALVQQGQDHEAAREVRAFPALVLFGDVHGSLQRLFCFCIVTGRDIDTADPEKREGERLIVCVLRRLIDEDRALERCRGLLAIPRDQRDGAEFPGQLADIRCIWPQRLLGFGQRCLGEVECLLVVSSIALHLRLRAHRTDGEQFDGVCRNRIVGIFSLHLYLISSGRISNQANMFLAHWPALAVIVGQWMGGWIQHPHDYVDAFLLYLQIGKLTCRKRKAVGVALSASQRALDHFVRCKRGFAGYRRLTIAQAGTSCLPGDSECAGDKKYCARHLKRGRCLAARTGVRHPDLHQHAFPPKVAVSRALLRHNFKDITADELGFTGGRYSRDL
jgi:hypothetical protein